MGMFYQVTLSGSASGQDIKNILYYRVGFGIDMTAFDFAGAQALAGAVKDVVWPSLKQLVCNQYTLNSIDVKPINDEFELVYQMPYSLAVGEAGALSLESAGPAMVQNFKFILEPTSILNGIKPPSRGYLAVGPLPASDVGEDGLIKTARMNGSEVSNFCRDIAQNLEVLLPVPTVWFPCRLKQSRILGGLIHWESFADVKGAVASRRASFRRSRMVEG